MLLFRFYLLIVPHLLCGVALLIAIRKKVHKRFPAFVTLLAFSFIFELVITLSIGFFFQAIYKWWVVADVAAMFLLGLLVLYELAREVLLSRPSLKRLFNPMPRWTAAALVLIAAASTALLPQTTREQAMNIFESLNFGLNLIAIGLLLAMLLFTRVLGISWRGIPAGIALGFGVVAAAEMATSTLMAHLGKGSYIPVDIVRMIAFHVCVVVWVVYLLLPGKSPHSDGGTMQISDLEHHLQELQRMVQP
jgi:hypothetical protein